MVDKQQAARKPQTRAAAKDSAVAELGSNSARPVGLPSYFSEGVADDRLIYEKIRLGIVSALAINRSLSFSELKELLSASDGNLSVHARKLEDASYIACKKSFNGRMPKTDYHLTAKGRRAFQRYLDHMEALIEMARNH